MAMGSRCRSVPGCPPRGASLCAGTKGGRPFDERCCVLGLQLMAVEISELHQDL